MQSLSPTIWRTCRVLKSPVRLHLLQTVLFRPGLNVTELARVAEVGVSDASQELRRLQSRGLIRRTPQGRSVVYQPFPDPLVASAAPLLEALRVALKNTPRPYEPITRIAGGLACERRALMVRLLRKAPLSAPELAGHLQTDSKNIAANLRILMESGWIARTGRTYLPQPADSPVHIALLNLL